MRTATPPAILHAMLPSHHGWKLLGIGLLVLAGGAVLLRGRRERRRAGRSVWPVHALLAALTLVAMLVVLETLFYSLYDQTDAVSMSNASRRWFDRYVRVNAAGFRDDQEFRRTPPPGVFRIGLVGDSVTMGHGIRRPSDRFGDLLRERFDRESPGRFQIYNLGLSGTDTSFYLLELKTMHKAGYRFHMLLLAYNMNDAGSDLPENERMMRRFQQLEPRRWIVRDTYLYNFLYCRAIQHAVPEVRDYCSWAGQGFEEPYWSRHRAELERIIEQCHESQMALRVVTFPLVQCMAEDYPLRAAHARLATFWEEKSVPQLDLLDVFEGRSAAELVVNRFDGHPNELAHRLAAEAIYTRLLEGDPLIEDARGSVPSEVGP